MLLQPGAIAPSSLGLWALTFILGGLVAGFGWLVRRHYSIAVPAYRRIFGNESDPTDDGHLADTESRFDTVDEAIAGLKRETDSIHDDVKTVERRQDTVLSNQTAIAEALDVDLENPRSHRDDEDDAERHERNWRDVDVADEDD